MAPLLLAALERFRNRLLEIGQADAARRPPPAGGCRALDDSIATLEWSPAETAGWLTHAAPSVRPGLRSALRLDPETDSPSAFRCCKWCRFIRRIPDPAGLIHCGTCDESIRVSLRLLG